MRLKRLFSGMMLSNTYNIMSAVLWFLNVKFRGNGHLNNAVSCARSSLTAAPMTSNTFYSFCCHRQSYFHRALARWHHQQQQQRATWLPCCWPSAVLMNLPQKLSSSIAWSGLPPTVDTWSKPLNVSTANLRRSHPHDQGFRQQQ